MGKEPTVKLVFKDLLGVKPTEKARISACSRRIHQKDPVFLLLSKMPQEPGVTSRPGARRAKPPLRQPPHRTVSRGNGASSRLGTNPTGRNTRTGPEKSPEQRRKVPIRRGCFCSVLIANRDSAIADCDDRSTAQSRTTSHSPDPSTFPDSATRIPATPNRSVDAGRGVRRRTQARGAAA